MKKRFNITGVCVPEKHYMVDISGKISEIMNLIEWGDYFVINRPRQYGKTTTLFLLDKELKKDRNYLVMDISFEGIDTPTYADQTLFIPIFLDLVRNSLGLNHETEAIDYIDSQGPIRDFHALSKFITGFVEKMGRRMVLLIDEVDKSSNNSLFLDFLGMLRTKYLKREEGKDFTFHSVILAGVHDVKSLKAQIRPEEDKKLNSPWNIAADFEVDLSFSAKEIESMLHAYSNERKVKIDIPLFAGRIFYLTSGYPFLVSQLCKIIDEKILPGKQNDSWEIEDLDTSLQMTIHKDNTNFESLIDNIENIPNLYGFVFKLIMNGVEFSFNRDNPVIRSGVLHGILKKEGGKVKIHNCIYEQIIHNYILSKMETSC